MARNIATGNITGTIGYVPPTTTTVAVTYHKHHECHHQIQYCSGCDAAYCTKCGKEWGNKSYWYPYWNNTNDAPPNFTVTSNTAHTHY